MERVFWDHLLEMVEKVGEKREELKSAIKAMAERGVSEEALQKFVQVLVAPEVGEIERREELLTSIAVALGRAGRFSKALSIARSLKSSCDAASAVCGLARSMAERRILDTSLWEQVFQVVQRIGRVERRCEALIAMAKSLVQVGLLDQARQALEQALKFPEVFVKGCVLIEYDFRNLKSLLPLLQEVGCVPSSFWKGLLSLLRREELFSGEKAQNLVALSETMEKLQVRNFSLWEEVLQVTEEIKRDRDQYDKVEVLAGIAKSMAKLGFLEQAEKVFARVWEMARCYSYSHSVRGVEVLSTVAKMFAKAGFLEQAKEAFSLAMEGVPYVEEQWEKSEAMRYISTALEEAVVSDFSIWEKAVRTAKGIGNACDKVKSLVALSQAMEKVGFPAQALDTLAYALQVAREIGDVYNGRSDALAAVARAMARLWGWQKALQIVKAVQDECLQSEALLEVAKALARAGEWHLALKVAGDIQVAWCRLEAVKDLAKQFSRHGVFEFPLWELVLGFLEKLEKRDIFVFQTIVQAMGEGRVPHSLLWKRVLQMVGSFEKDCDKRRGVYAVGESLVKAEVRDAEVWKLTLDMASRIPWDVERVKALKSLAAHLVQAGQYQILPRWQGFFHLSSGVKFPLVFSYYQALLEQRELPLSAILEASLLFPFHPSVSCASLCLFYLYHLRRYPQSSFTQYFEKLLSSCLFGNSSPEEE